ncbi:unnamed protein product [Dovyalis caffra]|uniref:Uncharacterized protein n=1 Tax=Dovyalis caffra TaxID=77055 RepID=A0AAV1RUS5_9ROSI|nr:unnamed protein product [Dovyalis caffra]
MFLPLFVKQLAVHLLKLKTLGAIRWVGMGGLLYVARKRNQRKVESVSMPDSERSAKMETTQKVLLILAISMLVLATNVEGGRKLKDTEEKVVQPQNYLGGFGTSGGYIPTPNGPVFQLGPSGFCSYPGVGCVRVPGTGAIGSPP